MTFGEMLIFTRRFQYIVNTPTDQYHKDMSLAALMDDLMKMFDIPMFYNEEYERNNPELMMLYRTVSDARKL
ncbi:hypothetical protein [Halobacillus sp. BBL2006]|uniref:hypothetical protein n=1 Tax=Halobacillus sp. BBL2006 TaxID=1543706 RepID=UPI000542C026|nr:hypothetical protein [Halobacillus sp. BBL2006]KHE70697.1 hypothetical protein LD39_11270 [Halobacillus sp. BBL2006]